jgi:hypothetical protein
MNSYYDKKQKKTLAVFSVFFRFMMITLILILLIWLLSRIFEKELDYIDKKLQHEKSIENHTGYIARLREKK